MRKILLVLLVSVFGIAVFGIGVGPVLDNWVLPYSYYEDYEEVTGSLVLSFLGLRLAVGPIDLAISTPFYTYISAEGSSYGESIEPGQVWLAYGGLRIGFGLLYLLGRVETVLSESFEYAGGYLGAAGLGLKLGGLFVEGGTLFDFEDISGTAGQLYQVSFGLLF